MPTNAAQLAAQGLPTSDASVRARLAQQLRAQNPTFDWNIQGIDRADELAGLMQAKGITDLSQFTSGTLAAKDGFKIQDSASAGGTAVLKTLAERRGDLGGSQLKVGNQSYGFLGDINRDGSHTLSNDAVLQKDGRVAWSSAGDGATNYWLRDGKFGADWSSTSDAYVARDLASIGAVIGGGLAIGNAMGGAVGAGAGEAGAGLGGAGAGAGAGAADPLSAYLTTGAADGSVVGGAGGYAGAITGSPEVLTTVGGSTTLGGTGGYWNGTDFTGAKPLDLGTKLGSAADAVTKGMGFSDWLNLFNTGAGLYMSNKNAGTAQDLANQGIGMSKEWLDFAKQQWTANQPYVTASQQAQTELTKALTETMGKQNDLADEYANYQRTTFRPLEEKIVSDAQNYDTPEKRAAAAEAAMSDVNTNMGALQQARARRLAAEGINPGSMRAMAALDGQNVDQALALTTAARQARQGVEATGFARQMDAASLGRNLPSAQATAVTTGINAGGAASGAATAGANAALPTANYLNQAYAGSGSLLNTATSILNNAEGQSANLWSNLGSSIGRTSDRNLKTDVKPEGEGDPEQALQEINATPVQNWKYDPAAMAARGLDIPANEQGENTGPMAQDAQATMGDEVAPGGKEINLGNMLGKTMLAVKGLDKKVNQLAGSVAQLIQAGQISAGASA